MMEVHIDRSCINMIIRAAVIALLLSSWTDAASCVTGCVPSLPSQFMQATTSTAPASREVAGRMIRPPLVVHMPRPPGDPEEGKGGQGGYIHDGHPTGPDASGGRSGASEARRLGKDPQRPGAQKEKAPVMGSSTRGTTAQKERENQD
ncbi:hypothetical protein D1007_28262 [Hordeum vulgare]|nr:hypothetical protein D1007_28262 [Hordeum vulgare]